MRCLILFLLDKKSTNTNSEKNFEKCDEIKIDLLKACQDISEKEIKSTNQVNSYDSFDNLKTEKSDTFKKGMTINMKALIYSYYEGNSL